MILRTFKPLLRLFRPSGRRFWRHGLRVHIELSPVRTDERVAYHERIAATLEQFSQVERVQMAAHLRRVIVHCRTTDPPLKELVEAVDAVSKAFPPSRSTAPGDHLRHPADEEAAERIEAEALSDLVSVALSVVLKLSDRTPNDIEAELASVVTLLDNTPRLKALLSGRLGDLAADVTLGLANSLAQGVAGGPASPLIDYFVQQARLKEVRQQRALWQRTEERLFGGAPGASDAARGAVDEPDGIRSMERPKRPVPLDEGVIERYANDAWKTSLGAFAIGIADTEDLRMSMAPMMAGVPKPALIAREVYAARIAARLAERDVLSVLPDRLRRMDRIDAVVLDQRLLRTDRLLMGQIVRTSDTDLDTARRVIRALYDPDDPTAFKSDGTWTLQLVETLERGISPSIRDRIETLSSEGARVLILSRGNRTRAMIQLRPSPSLAARALVRAINDAGLTLYIVGRDAVAAAPFRPAEVWSPEDSVEEVRDLQREGSTVLACALRDSPMLPHADVALLIARDKTAALAPADVIAFGGLADAAFLVACCGEARRVAKQGVGLTAMGATVAAGSFSRGLKKVKAERISNAVNLAATVALVAATHAARNVQAPPDADEEAEIAWHAIPHDDIIATLKTREEGLTHEESRQRQRIVEAPPSDARLFARAVAEEMANPLTPLLAAGAGVSASVGSRVDAAIVGSVIAFNGLFAGYQRFRAERAIASLEATERVNVRVRRDGRTISVLSEEVVVGDIIEVRAGDLIPVDARIIEAQWVEVDESALTGESLPTAKSALRSFSAALGDRHSMLFAGTAMATGNAVGVVVATGADTEAARAVRATRGASNRSGVHARLEELMQLTLPTAATSAALLFTSGLIRREKVHELMQAAVNLAVASVPEGLPLLASTAEMAAAERLSRRGALVRNPSAMEALGRIDTLCLDKTGTLTTGELRLKGLIDARSMLGSTTAEFDGVDDADRSEHDHPSGRNQTAFQPAAEVMEALGSEPEPGEVLDEARIRILYCARQASPHGLGNDEFAHRTDMAIVHACEARGIARDGRVIDELPFRPTRMYHATLLAREGARGLLCVKGAPEELLRRSTTSSAGRLSRSARNALLAQAIDLAEEGYRVLAIADGEHRGLELDDKHVQKLRFLGFLCLSDPIRPSSKETIARLRDAGIQPVMLTGDHASTARRIADELALGNGESILSGPEIDAMDDDALAERLAHVTIVARAAPAHKLRLVRVFQGMGRVVGMTGDGGNDAPAIRLADAGIAIGEHATRAARDASDVIIRDGSLATIMDAVAEGRGMWGSVRDATSLLIGGNLGEIGYMVAGGLIGGTPPLGSRQLLLVNLFTDVAPALTIALRRPPAATDEDLLEEGPETSLGQQLSEDIAWRGLITAGSATAAWLAARSINGDARATSTVGLLTIVGAQLGQTLMIGGLSDRQLVLASLFSSATLFGLVMTPGVSGTFGCRPVGPINLSIALLASACGTLAASAIPRSARHTLLHLPSRAAERVGAWLDRALEEADALEMQRAEHPDA